MWSFRPERVLRLLDTLDAMAYAARLACAGRTGRRFAAAAVAVAIAGTMLTRLPSLLAG